MKQCVQLPKTMPVFTTYHYQGDAAILLAQNSTLTRWYWNACTSLQCDLRFLDGFSSLGLTVPNSAIGDIPYAFKVKVPYMFLKRSTNTVIMHMLDEGYGVVFGGVDDFYLPGKTFFKTRHFPHDGVICGYDRSKKTFTILAYDEKWVYRTFDIPWSCFAAGIRARKKDAKLWTVKFTACRMMGDRIPLDGERIVKGLRVYLDTANEANWQEQRGTISGTVVHVCMARYLEMLRDGDIPYEKKDWRIFRLLWEHKKCMLERLRAMEEKYRITEKGSELYTKVVAESDRMRMLYALCAAKNQPHVPYLDSLIRGVIGLREQEMRIITPWLNEAEERVCDAHMGRTL